MRESVKIKLGLLIRIPDRESDFWTQFSLYHSWQKQKSASFTVSVYCIILAVFPLLLCMYIKLHAGYRTGYKEAIFLAEMS